MRKIFAFLSSRYTVGILLYSLPCAAVSYALWLHRDAFTVVSFKILLGGFTALGVSVSPTAKEQKRLWYSAAILLPSVSFCAYLSSSLKSRLTPSASPFGSTARKNRCNTPKISLDPQLSKDRREWHGVGYDDMEGEFIYCGEEYFDMLFRDISYAKESVYLEYFIISEGCVFSELCRLLIRKAMMGVRIKLNYDGYGSLGGIRSETLRRLGAYGIELCAFNLGITAPLTHHNSRDHRKIAIIDGTIIYTGGINLADEYSNKKNRFGYWKDCGVRLVTGGEKVTADLFGHTPLPRHKSDRSYHFILYTSVPRYLSPHSSGKENYLKLIAEAKRRLYITTPYLTAEGEVTRALAEACRRGVDLRIIVPGKKDKPLVGMLTDEVCLSLVRAGASVYKFTPGFIHQKTAVADGRVAMIGTVNFDERSFCHNYENGVVAIDEKIAQEAEEDFILCMSLSEPMRDEAEDRGILSRLQLACVRLFSPLL